MPYLKVRGICIMSEPHKESNRIVRILTAEHGLLRAIASGAAKSGSRFAFATQPLMLCDFVLTMSHDFYYIKEAEVVFSFREIMEDIVRLTAAAHILEIAGDISFDREGASLLYPLLLYTLHDLNRKERDYRLTVSIFEWKATDISGFSADLNGCDCSESDLPKLVAFSFDSCRLFCSKTACLRRAGRYQLLGVGTIQALRYIYASDNENLFTFSVSDSILSEMSQLTRRFLSDRLEKRYTRLDMLKDIGEV